MTKARGAPALVRLLVLVSIAGALVSVPALAASAASQGCGSLPSGDTVYMGRPGSCQAGDPSRVTLSFTDGQREDLAMGANHVFSPSDSFAGDIVAMECQYTTGAGPGDPPNENYCDAQTASGDFPFTVNADGSFDYQVRNQGDLVAFFKLPGKYWPHATITCNATHACVWYVGEDYQAFSKPHVFSNPFYVGAVLPPSGSFPVWLVVVLILAAVVVALVVYQRSFRTGRRVQTPA